MSFSFLLNQFSPPIELTLIQADSVTFTPKLQTRRWQLTKKIGDRETCALDFLNRQSLLTIGSRAHRRGRRTTEYVIEKASKLGSRRAELHQRAPTLGWETSGRTY